MVYVYILLGGEAKISDSRALEFDLKITGPGWKCAEKHPTTQPALQI